MHEEHRTNPENTRRKTKKKQKRKPIHRLITKRELMKEGRESLVVSPQARDQSKRVPLKEASI